MLAYILFSELRSRYYVGQTASIAERLKRHNQGRVPSTKLGVPWKIVLQIGSFRQIGSSYFGEED